MPISLISTLGECQDDEVPLREQGKKGKLFTTFRGATIKPMQAKMRERYINMRQKSGYKIPEAFPDAVGSDLGQLVPEVVT
jgi:hypothetical protein